MLLGRSPVTPLTGEPNFSWTRSLKPPVAFAATTRFVEVPFKRVVVSVSGVHWLGGMPGDPIATISLKSG